MTDQIENEQYLVEVAKRRLRVVSFDLIFHCMILLDLILFALQLSNRCFTHRILFLEFLDYTVIVIVSLDKG